MMTTKSNGADAPQRRSIHEVAELIHLYVARHASLDATLILAAARARRSGITSLEFVTLAKILAPRVSVPVALMAWLKAPRCPAAGSTEVAPAEKATG